MGNKGLLALCLAAAAGVGGYALADSKTDKAIPLRTELAPYTPRLNATPMPIDSSACGALESGGWTDALRVGAQAVRAVFPQGQAPHWALPATSEQTFTYAEKCANSLKGTSLDLPQAAWDFVAEETVKNGHGPAELHIYPDGTRQLAVTTGLCGGRQANFVLFDKTGKFTGPVSSSMLPCQDFVFSRS